MKEGYNIMNHIVAFLMTNYPHNSLMELIHMDIYSEEKVDTDIKEILNKYDKTYLDVDVSKMLEIYKKDMDIEQAFDEIINLIKTSHENVFILDEWHLMFMNILKHIHNDEYIYEACLDELKVKIKELINVLSDNKKVIFKTSQYEHKRYVEPLLTESTSGRLKKVYV